MQRRIMLMSPAVFMLIAFGVVPLFIMFYFSFLTNGPHGSFTLQNYTDFFSKDLYLKLTAKTVQLSLTVTLICLIVAYPMAYIMAKIIRKGKGLLLLLIIIPFWTSALVRAYSWVNLLRDGGLLEIFLRNLNLIEGSLGILFTQTAVIIGLVHIYFPYMVITIFMSLEKLDDAILDAAQSLGATPFTTFRRITLPMSKVGILTGSILVFIPCLGSFVEPRILGGINGSVIGTIIEDQFFEIYGWNFGAAIAFILLAMVLASMGLAARCNKEG